MSLAILLCSFSKLSLPVSFFSTGNNNLAVQLVGDQLDAGMSQYQYQPHYNGILPLIPRLLNTSRFWLHSGQSMISLQLIFTWLWLNKIHLVFFFFYLWLYAHVSGKLTNSYVSCFFWQMIETWPAFLTLRGITFPAGGFKSRAAGSFLCRHQERGFRCLRCAGRSSAPQPVLLGSNGGNLKAAAVYTDSSHYLFYPYISPGFSSFASSLLSQREL